MWRTSGSYGFTSGAWAWVAATCVGIGFAACAGEVSEGVSEDPETSSTSSPVPNIGDQGPPEEQADAPADGDSPVVDPPIEVLARPASEPEFRPEAPVVRGIIEIGTGRGQYVPARYVRVVLEGARRHLDALTNRRGVYVFLDAVPGTYSLTVTDAMSERTMHRGEVTIPPADTTITLPDVHIERPLILWVDDSPQNNETLIRTLSEYGIAVWIATSTEEAMEELEDADYDLVITDMGRPLDPMAGYTLLRSMRERGSSVPVIVFSTSRNIELHNQQVQDSSAVGQVTRGPELLRLVEETLGRS